VVRRAEIVAGAETPPDDRLSFASAFRRALKPELHSMFLTVLAGLPPPESPRQPKPAVNHGINDDSDSGLFLPGVFGHQKALSDADELLVEADRHRTLGNSQAAKTQAVKVLKTAQEGGWGIWSNLSDGTGRAKAILVEGETNAANVIRYFAPLIEAERNFQKWIPTQHLIGQVGSLLGNSESQRLLDVVIEHVRLVVGDATQEIQGLNFLADNAIEPSPSVEFFRFIVWLCNHPKWLRRDRAGAALIWLVEELPELISVAATTAFSMDDGYGPDVLCGVLDGASAREPVALWDRIAGALDVARIAQELRHFSRMVVLQRLLTRADKGGSSSAKSALKLIQEPFTGKGGTAGNLQLPRWAECLAREWRQLEDLLDRTFVATWEKEMERSCSPLSITEARGLEVAVSDSFRENPDRALNRWESKLRYALNLALFPHLSRERTSEVEATLRIYNPSQPERTVLAIINPVSDQLLTAIVSGNYSSALGSNATVLLNYHDIAVRSTKLGACHVEVLCVLYPFSNQWGSAPPKLGQFFWSSRLPLPLTINTPFETCCRLHPEVVFFNTFTPAIPLPFFQMLVAAKNEDFVRINWRYGRRNQDRGFGLPEREGCSLTVARKALKIPPGFKLAWIVWLDEEVVAFVDERNNRII
jgi:hypothetical protein